MRNDRYFDDMHVGELVELAFGRIPEVHVGRNVWHPAIRQVYESFGDLSDNIVDLAKLPPRLVLQSITCGIYAARAMHEETGSFETKKLSDEQQESVRLRFQRIDPGLSRITKKKLLKQVSENVRLVLGRADSTFQKSMTALLPALIVYTWTAFETLTEELFNAAVKLRPHLLPSHGRSIGPRKLQPYEMMTLRGGMETVGRNSIRGKKAHNFRSLKDIRDAYYATFHLDARKLDTVLLHNRRLDSLHALRNIIIHCGGRADRLFVSRMTGVSKYGQIKAGEIVKPDFTVIGDFVRPVLIDGVKLVRLVDDWIRKHP